jgi:predicted O-linked N-acetylglucosamine transferase (SPINDLY family)
MRRDVIFARAKHFYDLQHYAEALSLHSELVREFPHYSNGYLGLGNEYFRTGQYDTAAQFYERAVALAEPANLTDAETQSLIVAIQNWAQSCRQLGRHSEAVGLLSIALDLSAGLNKTKQTEDYAQQLISLVNILAAQLYVVDWRSREVREAELLHLLRQQSTSWVPNRSLDPFTVSLIPFLTLELETIVNQMSCAGHDIPFFDFPDTFRCKLIGQSQEEIGQTVSQRAKTLRLDCTTPPRLLRIAYLSYDWRDHPMGRLTARLVTSHNTSRVAAKSLSYGPDEPNPVYDFVKQFSPEFRDFSREDSDSKFARAIYGRGSGHEAPHILVDLVVHTFNGRIGVPGSRPAPLVLNYLGYPGSSGCKTFDYIVLDSNLAGPMLVPSFSERLLLLSGPYQSNFLPLHIWPRQAYSNPSLVGSSSQASLSENLIINITNFRRRLHPRHIRVCAVNSNKKFEQVSFTAWMNFLRRVPRAVLYVLIDDRDGAKKLISHTLYTGISPQRLVLFSKLDWESHLVRLSGCDLALDTFVYGAHTTASDALWVGVPLLSLEGWGAGRMPSRVAASIVRSLFVSNTEGNEKLAGTTSDGASMGHLPLLVHQTVRQYEDTSIRITSACPSHTQRTPLRALGDNILMRTLNAPTFDSARMQLSVEAAYEGAWEMRTLESAISFLPLNSAGLPKRFHLVMRTVSLKSNIPPFVAEAIEYTEGLLLDARSRMCCVIEAIAKKVMNSNFPNESLSINTSDASINDFLDTRIFSLQTLSKVRNIFDRISLSHPHWESDLIADLKRTTAPDTEFDSTIKIEGIHDVRVLPSPLLPKLESTLALIEKMLVITSPPRKLQHLRAHLWARWGVSNSTNHSICCIAISVFCSCPDQACSMRESLLQALLSWQRVIVPLERSLVHDFIFVLISEIYLERRVWSISDICLDMEAVGPGAVGTAVKCTLSDTLPSAFFSKELPQFSLRRKILSSNHSEGNQISPKLSEKLEVLLGELLLEFAVSRFHALQYSGSITHDGISSSSGLLLGLFASSFFLRPVPLTLRNLAVTLELSTDTTLREAAPDVLSFATKLSGEARYEAHKDELSALQVHKTSTEAGTFRVIIYCDEYGQSWWPGWGPSSVTKGLGGSEEAVIYTARALARSGRSGTRNCKDERCPRFVVDVYNDAPARDWGTDSQEKYLSWFPLWAFKSSDAKSSDIFIAWRYPVSLAMADNPRRFIWLHDLLDTRSLPAKLVAASEAIFVQSIFHKNSLPPYAREKVVVAPNGIDELFLRTDLEAPCDNSNDEFVYGSAPYRGLELVLQQWPVLRAASPNVRLQVLYGFTPAVERYVTQQLGTRANYEKWRQGMQV